MPARKTTQLPIEVRDSPIHGAGAFASRSLKPGQIVGRYAGRLYRADEVQTRDWDHELTFVFGLSDGSVLDGAEGGNATRHINHSCAPNCVAYEMEVDDGLNYIQIEAMCRIAMGEELFLDYGLDAGQSSPEDYPCRCGATACRGSLVAPFVGV